MSRRRVSFDDRWQRSFDRLQPRERKKVEKAIAQLADDASANGLNYERVQGCFGTPLRSIRASKELRIAIAEQGREVIALFAGHHDEVYERCSRIRPVFNAGTESARVVERREGDVGRQSTSATNARYRLTEAHRGPLAHWKGHELAEAGLTESEVALVRECFDEDHLINLDVPYERRSLFFELVPLTPAEWRTPPMDLDAAQAEHVADAMRNGRTHGLSPLLDAKEVEQILTSPVEDWMLFLHPDQRHAVRQRWAGPARVRGPAGTGKTAVLLHRAAELTRRFAAEEDQPGSKTVLVTTLVRNLPSVYAGLYRRMPGTTDDDDIVFLGVHDLARQVCVDAGVQLKESRTKVENAFQLAWRYAPSQPEGLSLDYVKDEIAWVIKGRGISELSDYLDIDREGRRVGLREGRRRQIWEIYLSYQDRLDSAGVVDSADILLTALAPARAIDGPKFRAVLVDEAQDVTLVGLSLLRTLVAGYGGSDRSDAIFLADDAAQKVYPGGFTPGQAGIDLPSARTRVLRHNYRNAPEILDGVLAVTGAEHVEGFDGDFERGTDAVFATRPSGRRPRMVVCSTSDIEDEAVVDEVGRMVSSGTPAGDIAVLTATRKRSSAVQRRLEARSIRTVDLKDYDGTPTGKVKVGTHHRAKGLDFKVVLLPGLGEADFPPHGFTKAASDAEADERRSLAVSQLHVAMTRARDELVVFVSGNPSGIFTTLDGWDLEDGPEPEPF